MRKGKGGAKVVKGKGGRKRGIRYEATGYRAMFVQGQMVTWKGTSEHDAIKEAIVGGDKEKAVQALIPRVLKKTGWKQMPKAGSRVEAEASAPVKSSPAGAGRKRAATAGKTDDWIPKAALVFAVHAT